MAALETAWTVYLGLGSNQGDRAGLLREAVKRLAPAVLVEQSSSVYETPPWGYVEQPPFLNAVVRGRTLLSPYELLATLKQIERSLGRTPGPRYGPRPIDIDILLYNEIQLVSNELTIPHPRIAERSFVLVPLIEIDPNLRLVPGGPSVADLLSTLPDRESPQRVEALSLL